MGKRSDFERIGKDRYRTIDPRAVRVLEPHVERGWTFAEPCAGEGDLVRALEAIGMQCTYQDDLPNDALYLNEEKVAGADYIITNPPWSRDILHPMLDRFSALRPTWLLFDADWPHTRQSAPYMRWCRKIVSIGRLIWIPGTTMTGKDNVAWFLFDQATEGRTEFYGRLN